MELTIFHKIFPKQLYKILLVPRNIVMDLNNVMIMSLILLFFIVWMSAKHMTSPCIHTRYAEKNKFIVKYKLCELKHAFFFVGYQYTTLLDLHSIM